MTTNFIVALYNMRCIVCRIETVRNNGTFSKVCYAFESFCIGVLKKMDGAIIFIIYLLKQFTYIVPTSILQVYSFFVYKIRYIIISVQNFLDF